MGSRLPVTSLVAVAWLGIVLATTVAALQRGANFDSSILTLLPEAEQSSLLREANERVAKIHTDRLLLLVSGPDDPAVRAATGRLANALQQLDQIGKVRWRVAATEIAETRDALYPYRFSLLADGVRHRLREGDYASFTKRVLLRLSAPAATGTGNLVDDPFGLYAEYEGNRAGEFRLEIVDGMLQAQGTESPAYLVLLELAGDPFSADVQQAVLGAIERQRALQSAAIDEILISGLLVHAAAGAKQAKSEISTIGLGSLLGIALAVLVVFARLKPLLLLLFPVMVGCAFAASVTLLIYERVHLVTFAFGAGLVGLSIDYSLHYLCQRRASPPGEALDRILAGLVLGLFSSATAFAVMLMTPFPGLRQMATFSVAGLVGAWLTVVLWLPLLTSRDAQQPIPAAAILAAVRDRFPRVGDARWPGWLMAAAAVLSLAVLWYGEGRDDVRLLQTSPRSLLSQEASLQGLLGIADGSRYLLVTADDIERCLQLEESLRPELDRLVADGLIEGYQALSSSLPSLRRQAENRELVAALYSAQLRDLYATLKLSPGRLAAASERLGQAGDRPLTPARWRELGDGASLADRLVEGDGYSATLVRLRDIRDTAGQESLQRIADATPGVFYVDRVRQISQLMKQYRQQIGQWIMIAYLLVMLVLLLRYRGESWRIILPPLLASLLTLAIQVQIEGGLNLFNMLAVILILGIGLDMGIFLSETGEAAHTWLAVSLSAYTSLLAFGLLSFSATPVLYHFGIVVATGLCLVWLITPLVRRHGAGEARV